jgi:hypothetical protein
MGLAEDILNTFEKMKDDHDFADGIATACTDYFNTKKVLTEIPPPSPVPVTAVMTSGNGIIYTGAMTKTDAGIAAGIANGVHNIAVDGTTGRVFSGDPSSIQSGLIVIFNAMTGMNSGGDKYFADELAALVETYASAGGML